MPFFFCLAGVVQKSWFPVGQGGILVFASALVHTTRRLFVNLLGVKNRRFSMRLHERRTIAWKGPKTCERACTACDSMYVYINKSYTRDGLCCCALKTGNLKLDSNNMPRRHNRLYRQQCSWYLDTSTQHPHTALTVQLVLTCMGATALELDCSAYTVYVLCDCVVGTRLSSPVAYRARGGSTQQYHAWFHMQVREHP